MELLHELMQQNFLEYSSYVIKDRAIPDIRDGLKPVQRRILHTLHEMDDGKFHKVANVVGSCMKYHPHGDASIYSALVNLANKGYFLERQGNFGNIFTGDDAAAARYIESRLTPLAKEVLFNPHITDYVDSYDGRNQEPVIFPCKISYLLLSGAEGIAVGMATKILPHNFVELLDAQINILKGEPYAIYPDFPQGGLLDISEYEQGNGRVRIRAVIEKRSQETLVITEIPFSTNTEMLTDSIEEAAKKGKIKVSKINDYTAENVEISISVVRGTNVDETIQALYAFTACEVTLSASLLILDERYPQYTNVNAVLERNTKDLLYILKQELYYELHQLQRKLHHKQLEQIFIENRLYKKLESCETEEKILTTLEKSLAPFLKQLEFELLPADLEKLLQLRIKRISQFDIQQSQQEIQEIRIKIEGVYTHLKEIRNYAIQFLKTLLKNYGGLYPRKTHITTFQDIDPSKVAQKNIKVGYDKNAGYLGTTIKSDPYCECNPYQKLILIQESGILKVIHIPEKIFLEQPLEYFGVYDKNTLWTVLYKDLKNYYLSRFSVTKFQLDKEYVLFPEGKNRILFISTNPNPQLELKFSSEGDPKIKILDVEKFSDIFLLEVAQP
ncbi:MAG: DNA topoisomerase IV subunit A, partial [Planctomycetota bacterium]